MKKFLALALACFVMLGSVLSVTAAEIPAETQVETSAVDIETEEVVALLKYLNIITDGENLEENVTRSDFAVYAAKLMKLDTESSVQYFDDVEASSKAAGAINALAEYGYISSGDGITYKPYDNVKTNEALKVFMTMLGYNKMCEFEGGYPTGYTKIAKRIDLNKGITDEYLSRGQLYALMYRTLIEPICEISSIDQDGSMKFKKDDDNNILLERHELRTIEGYVNTVGSVAADGEEPLDEGLFRIEDKVMRTDLIADDMYEYLGTNVKVYYFEEERIDATAALVIPYFGKNDVLSIKNDDIIDIQDSGKEYTFEYYDEDDKKDKVEIPRGAVIIKNGETVLVDVFDELHIDKGSYKFVDTDGDNKYDVLFVYEYYNIVVGTIEDKEGMVYIKQTAVSNITDWIFYRGRVGSKRAVYDKYTNDLNIDLTEDGSKVIKYKDTTGRIIDLADISKEEVISVYKSKSGNYIEVYKGKDPVRGEVKKISTSDIKGAEGFEIVINDKAYFIAQSVIDQNPMKLKAGLKATFYFDCFGEIGAYVADSLADIKFAYLVDVVHEKIGFSSGETMVKMFTQDGEFGIYNCSDRIKIDGTVCKEREDAFNALSTHTKQPIRFLVDEDDNLTFVDTTYYNPELEGNVSIYNTLEEGTYTKGSNIVSFSDQLIYKSATPVFYVPEDEAIDGNTYMEEHFYMKQFSNLVNDSSINKLSSYRVDRDAIFDDVIVIKAGNVLKGWTQQNVYLVDSIMTVLNNDGDVVQCVYAYLNGDLKKFNCKSDCEDLSGKINKGDIVWFDVNEKNEIKSLEEIIVDVENGKATFNTLTTLTGGEQVWSLTKLPSTITSSTIISPSGKYAAAGIGSYFSMVSGYAGKTRDGALCFAYNKDDALKGDYDFVKNIGSINILVFDKEQGVEGSIYKSGLDDIITVKNSYEDCSMVCMFMRNKNLKTVYVYK